MAIKDLLGEIETDVKDMKSLNFEYSSTNSVPSRHDNSFTFESGKDKTGKTLKSCVLYVDIRNSVELNRKHYTQTMGRIYSIFSKSMLKIAKYHSGAVRNIIGDRVMIVFQSENCFTNSVNCAISIFHASEYLINKVFSDVDFKCGIGIDYGELNIVKVGIRRQGTENFDNKNLVWAGYPANLASRLTDVANKEIEEEYYEVKRKPINPRAITTSFGVPSLLGYGSSYAPNAPLHLSTIEKVTMTPEEFADSLRQFDSGGIFTVGGKMISFEKKKSKIKYPPILFSEAVYKGFKAANPNGNSLKNNFWKEVSNEGIKNITSKVYGGEVYWII
ncbi:MAG: adenylate/guanylate cyclase domain-containing protein [Bacteroidota bacterium]